MPVETEVGGIKKLNQTFVGSPNGFLSLSHVLLVVLFFFFEQQVTGKGVTENFKRLPKPTLSFNVW